MSSAFIRLNKCSQSAAVVRPIKEDTATGFLHIEFTCGTHRQHQQQQQQQRRKTPTLKKSTKAERTKLRRSRFRRSLLFWVIVQKQKNNQNHSFKLYSLETFKSNQISGPQRRCSDCVAVGLGGSLIDVSMHVDGTSRLRR